MSGIHAVTVELKMFSNSVIALVAAVLVTAILLDGRIYNKTPEHVGIYNLSLIHI